MVAGSFTMPAEPFFPSFQLNRILYLPVVSPTSRRIFLYWLLLLVPTLVVGAAAILLLRREQVRLAERGAYADEARRAAITARARLIVENVELLVDDVETGLLDALAQEPAEGLEAFFGQWEKTNPLVRTAFRATPTGRMLWPDAHTADEDGRGFLRRFDRQFGNRPPWRAAPTGQTAAGEKREVESPPGEAEARKDVAANIAQVQSARRGVQELFKAQNAQNNYAADAVAANQPAAPATSLLDAPAARQRAARAESSRPAATPPPSGRGTAGSSSFSSGSRTENAANNTAPQTPLAASSKAETTLERRGWAPVTIDGRLHLFGWVQPAATGEVRGVEVDVAALISRLGGTLPAETSIGEGYALRDEQGRVLHQAGAIPRVGEPTVRVPFAAALLPGWDVAAYLTAGPIGSANSGAFFGVGVLLVAIFVAAILAGGSLLLRQARRSEEEAAQKTSFVANVSHEFKTPLTTIRLYSELLEQGRVRDAAQGNEYLRTIGRETQRLARLVNNALDFSRLEQGRKKYVHEEVDLCAELGRLLDTHEPRIAEAGLALRRELPAVPVRVATDRDAVEQIVLNLIDNACKYAASGGELVVAAQAGTDGGAEIRVADRGPGVPADHRERIFEKFHRVDDALTAEKTGAGLGLSIARQLARGLGGELRYAPRAGAGAEFILEVP